MSLIDCSVMTPMMISYQMKMTFNLQMKVVTIAVVRRIVGLVTKTALKTVTRIDKYAGMLPTGLIQTFMRVAEPNDDVDARSDWSYSDYMNKYIDSELFEKIADCTNRTSIETDGTSLQVTPDEIERFIGMTILMATIGYPQIEMLWKQSLKIPAIADVMSRRRYFKIRSHLKVVYDADVSDDTRRQDKLWKVRPVLDRVRQACLQIPRVKNVSIDKQMIPFAGACNVRQYICNQNPTLAGLPKFCACRYRRTSSRFYYLSGTNHI